MVLSICACLIVIFIITASPQATILVALCVLLTDFFLGALIFYWSLTMNTLVVLNIIIAIGLSVDYSAHISHSYLTTQIPDDLAKYYKTNKQKRVYKVQQALSKMGSSVFHGGFSTFLAIVTLAPSKTYIFVVFFRLWFGIILFGMANGFMLLPVILSFVGQINNVTEISLESDGEDSLEAEAEDLDVNPDDKVPAKDNRRVSVFQLSGQDKVEPSAVALQVAMQKSKQEDRFAKDNDSMEMQMINKQPQGEGKPAGSEAEITPEDGSVKRQKSLDLL